MADTNSAADSRTTVAVKKSTLNAAKARRQEIIDRTGLRPSIDDTIARALTCLKDAHADGAWLSPQETARIMAARVDDRLKATVGQVLARFVPDLRVERIEINHDNERLVIHIEGSEPVGIVGVVGATSEPSRTVN